ncbi:MAG: YciI family protein [Nitrospira sp.]|nr:YciI family protein [Nitrospira sp.]
MKFILLVHHDETAFEQMNEETKSELLAESIGLCHQLDAQGAYLHASPVHPAATATLVRVRDGRPLVTDGPFIETREQMAGYFLIDAKDREEAVAIAGRVPGARIGTVEVRPVREVTGLPE